MKIIKRIITLALIMVFVSFPINGLVFAENLVEINETNFPDKQFRD